VEGRLDIRFGSQPAEPPSDRRGSFTPESGLAAGVTSHHADAHLPDDCRAPFLDDLAQRAGPVDVPARHHRPPGNARTIVGNDSIADYPEAAHLEFGRKFSGCHVERR
jgi:hypothetical protein